MSADSCANLRYGPYVTPVAAVGVVVECEVRGLVEIHGMSDGPLQWPIGECRGERQLVVYKGLARAVRIESAEAVAAAWGVDLATAEGWKGACKQPRKRKKQTISSPPIEWKAADDEMLGTVTSIEAARLMGRTLTAVRKRRRTLGLPDGRLAAQRAQHGMSLESQAEAASLAVRQRMETLGESLAALRKTYVQAQASCAYWHARQRDITAAASGSARPLNPASPRDQ